MRSDVERKRLFGLRPEDRSRIRIERGIYSPQATEWTYQRLRALAATILECGYDALVDATFLAGAHRAAFQELAREHGAGFAILSLDAPIEVLRQRVARRLAAGNDASRRASPCWSASAVPTSHSPRRSCEFALRIDTPHPPPLMEILERIATLTGVPLGS